ncbi:20979_t:CDS:2 [Entrophospora sp. SA101]|nr:3571_t:CDS:2 [Entrophospora sp. SA101]CAJ0746946.1 20979_t:CDS:2 [Entrophospora sp. SA101]CAJ0827002.1 10612_t:CDS:2 [Entrophospora sp. SA101]
MIKEPGQWEENELAETVNEQELITYRGKLQPNGFNEEEEFYRCEMSKVEKKTAVRDDGSNSLTVFFIFIIIVIVLSVLYAMKGIKNISDLGGYIKDYW